MASRSAEAVWEGTLKEGSGSLKVGSGAFEVPYSWAGRFADGINGTNPEELIGAALAGCFTMQVGANLTNAGTPPTRLHTSANVHLEFVNEKRTITRIDLVMEGSVPGVDEATFLEHANKAKEGCIISRALGAVGEITLDARLVS